jgi:multiple sugar transport system substrate-binding protein
MPDPLRVAFIGGPMYDQLYASIADFECAAGTRVDIGFRAPHERLNEHLASLPKVSYDLVSTHTKYAPSQLSSLAPLDNVVSQLDVVEFYAPLMERARIEGCLYGLPRNIDVKLLHYRPDLMEQAPGTWTELVESARRLSTGRGFHGFVFPGRGSGLFGMFFELAEMAGARLFPASKVPQLNNEGGTWALEVIRELYRSGAVPARVVEWRFDEAHEYFRAGLAAMICDWPGYYGAYHDPALSQVSGQLGLARMPAGPGGIHKAYAGSHTFALTHCGIQRPEAVQLLRFLTSPERQLQEARQGSVPARPTVLAQMRSEAPAAEGERWRLLDCVIAEDMLVPPSLPYYPAIEKVLWRTVRSAMTGEMEIPAALGAMETGIAECHQSYAGQ